MAHRLSLDIGEAERALQRYNRDSVLTAADAVLDRAFAAPFDAADTQGIAERVVLIDALWQTQMVKERGALARVIRGIVENASMIQAELAALQPRDLLTDPTRVETAARRLLPAVLDAKGENGEPGKRHYSFATKFLHWTMREHFPIVDFRARRAVNALQRRAGAANRVPSMLRCHPTDDYALWIRFYSALVRDMGPEAERLQKFDREGSPARPARPSSLLRVLDKVFYVYGAPAPSGIKRDTSEGGA